MFVFNKWIYFIQKRRNILKKGIYIHMNNSVLQAVETKNVGFIKNMKES
jgi:hypothetical protein